MAVAGATMTMTAISICLSRILVTTFCIETMVMAVLPELPAARLSTTVALLRVVAGVIMTTMAIWISLSPIIVMKVKTTFCIETMAVVPLPELLRELLSTTEELQVVAVGVIMTTMAI